MQTEINQQQTLAQLHYHHGVELECFMAKSLIAEKEYMKLY